MKNIINHIITISYKYYSMPDECKKICAQKDSKKILCIMPVLFLWGIICIFLIKFSKVYTNNPEYQKLALIYALGLIFLCLICFFWCFFARKSSSEKSLSLTYPIYFSITIIQSLLLYNFCINHSSIAGYSAWITGILVTVIFFSIEPVYFTLTLIIQAVILVFFRPFFKQTGLINYCILLTSTATLAFTRWRLIIKDYKSTESLQIANRKSDKLLLNILPEKVVNDLRDTGKTDPELFKNVSILFTDIVGFTNISKQLPPETLISELNDMFTNFDIIMEKYNCIRIKTMGDAYMAVCGLPNSDPDHAKKIVQAGLDCLKYLNERNSTHKLQWQMRVGVNSGEAVAGIIGIRKYIYDVIGDSVNTAFRMQNASEPMRLTVSDSTYKAAKRDFKYKKRAPIEIKGKGMMTTYFVEK